MCAKNHARKYRKMCCVVNTKTVTRREKGVLEVFHENENLSLSKINVEYIKAIL